MPQTEEDLDSFRRFERLLKKTENFSKALSTGDTQPARKILHAFNF